MVFRFTINFSRLILRKSLFSFHRYHLKKLIKNSLKWLFFRLENLLNFGVRIAGASVRKTAELFGVTKSTVSNLMAAFEKEGKTSSQKQNSGRKRKAV